MRPIALLLSFLVLTSSGCVLGRSRSDKHGGYVLNGMAIMVGAGLALSDPGDDPCAGKDGCWSIDLVDERRLGYMLLGAGLLGIAINLLTPTKEPPPKPMAPARHVGTTSPAPAGSDAVSGPGPTRRSP